MGARAQMEWRAGVTERMRAVPAMYPVRHTDNRAEAAGFGDETAPHGIA